MSNQQPYWNAIIERYKASGLSRPEFCKQNDLSWNQFHYRWYQHALALKKSLKGVTINHPLPSDSFEKITISPPTLPQKPLTKVVDAAIHLPNQIRCKVTIDFCTNEFSTLLKQIESVYCCKVL